MEDLWGCGWWWWLNGGAAVGGGGGRGSSSTESRGCCEPDRRVDDEEDLRIRGNEEMVKKRKPRLPNAGGALQKECLRLIAGSLLHTYL